MFVCAVPRLAGGAHHHQTATGGGHRPTTELTAAGLLPMSPRQGAPHLMSLAPGNLTLHCRADCLLQNFLKAHFHHSEISMQARAGSASRSVLVVPEVCSCMGLIVQFIVDTPGVMAFQGREVATFADLVLFAWQLAVTQSD